MFDIKKPVQNSNTLIRPIEPSLINTSALKSSDLYLQIMTTLNEEANKAADSALQAAIEAKASADSASVTISEALAERDIQIKKLTDAVRALGGVV